MSGRPGGGRRAAVCDPALTAYFLPGSSAFPEFELGKRLATLRRDLPGATGISAWSAYFVDAAGSLDPDELAALGRLLEPSFPIDADPMAGAFRERPGPVRALVVPRAGTISPWSSKATDIARNCGFRRVRRIERGTLWAVAIPLAVGASALASLYDRMTERLLLVPGPARGSTAGGTADGLEVPVDLFRDSAPQPLARIRLAPAPQRAFREANRRLGLALDEAEIRWLCERYGALGRDPTDAELMMFAQANSEHCRHKTFNAAWTVDGRAAAQTLFDMIRHTHAANPGEVLSAYRDNAAVVEGGPMAWFGPDPETGAYRHVREPSGLLMKVETHNHPTGVSPFAGAATGSGGEIRDEAATGRGAGSRAGLVGFSVSSLRIPGFEHPWEAHGPGSPPHLASALQIMLEAPIGATRFGNEFGRPGLCGYFRTFERQYDTVDGTWHGYHKPIMIAGGMGRIRRRLVAKKDLTPGALIGVLGGPAMLIGLGGGAASSGGSAQTGAIRSAASAGGRPRRELDFTGHESSKAGDELQRRELDLAGHDSSTAADEHHRRELDFASVQRDNAEMQRRAQEVIDACAGLGDRNPILSIHDVGAGGLANAVPEIVQAAGLGARLELGAIPTAEPGMSPMEIWCNEAQERYVLALAPSDRARLESICRRERCPFAIIGTATQAPSIVLEGGRGAGRVVDVPLDLVLGDTPRRARTIRHGPAAARTAAAPEAGTDAMAMLERVLRLPCVADKSFLVTIGDRTVSGLVARDQMVGRWQVPVADCAVTLADHLGYAGEAMALGERSPLAVLDPAASARMAIGEALTNLAPAGIGTLSRVALSANWMADADHDATALHDAVRAVGLGFCPALGIPIPVGKDSLSMRTAWNDGGRDRLVRAPLSLVASAFAPVRDVRRVLTPVPARAGGNRLVLVDLGLGRHRLGGSALEQVSGIPAGAPPDAEADVLKGFFDAIQALVEDAMLVAYHDRADGGLAATLCEMAFAGRAGLRVDLTGLGDDPRAALFTEELGAVLQVLAPQLPSVLARLREVPRLAPHVHDIGEANRSARIRFVHRGSSILDAARVDLHRIWSETSYRMQSLRDDPECAREAFDALLDEADPGLDPRVAFPFGTATDAIGEPARDPSSTPRRGAANRSPRLRVAVLREQGVNGHLELAAAFERAGFEPFDVHMTDLLDGRQSLERFTGLAAGGGFSYGDVLGAGGGWAATVLHREDLREAFRRFFTRPDTFTLGICNGCQMLSRLRTLIPGAEAWPRFERNRSGRFEARLVMCEILESPSLFFRGMAGARLPVAVAHGEGRALTGEGATDPCLRFVDNRHRPAERYPANPNGSPGGLTGFTSRDGRATILMPHPERTFRTVQLSWHPSDWGEESPWLEMFRNARRWCARANGSL